MSEQEAAAQPARHEASPSSARESRVRGTPSSVPALQPSASYSITVRVRQQQRPGALARVAAAIGETGAIPGAINLVRVDHGEVVRDITLACVNAEHGEAVVGAIGTALPRRRAATAVT